MRRDCLGRDAKLAEIAVMKLEIQTKRAGPANLHRTISGVSA